jgi:hypothetical protein
LYFTKLALIIELVLLFNFTCLLLQSSKPESAKDSPTTPPLGKERPSNFHHPTGMGCSSSDSLDHHPMQSHQYYESAGLASTPKLSSIAGAKTETSSIDGSVRTSMSRESDRSEELSISNASDMETEWVEQDEPGVYITIRALPGGTRELRRVRFRSVGLNNLEKDGIETAHDFSYLDK